MRLKKVQERLRNPWPKRLATEVPKRATERESAPRRTQEKLKNIKKATKNKETPQHSSVKESLNIDYY